MDRVIFRSVFCYLVLCLSILGRLNSVYAQEVFHGGPIDRRLVSGEYRYYEQRQLPSYMPRPHPSWEGKKVKGRFVKQNSEAIGNLGYGIGRPPSKSASKQFHPRRRNTISGFGRVGMF